MKIRKQLKYHKHKAQIKNKTIKKTILLRIIFLNQLSISFSNSVTISLV